MVDKELIAEIKKQCKHYCEVIGEVVYLDR